MPRRHSEGASGGFRYRKQNVNRIKAADGRIHEYQVGPRNVHLSGDNYTGAQGASFSGIRKAINMAKTGQVQIAVLMRQYGTAQGGKRGGKFHWYQSKTRNSKRLVDALNYAEQAHFNVNEFAEQLLGLEYPVKDAVTWRVIEVYE